MRRFLSNYFDLLFYYFGFGFTWRLVVEYPTSDGVITCGTVAVVHRRPCLQHLACCSVSKALQIYGSESRFLPTPPAFDAPLGGSRRISPFRLVRTIEWCGYPMVKKNRRYIFIRFDRMYEHDIHTLTNTQTHTAWHTSRSRSIARQKLWRFSLTRWQARKSFKNCQKMYGVNWRCIQAYT